MKRLIWLLMLLASPAWATTYYVTKSGNDSHGCTNNTSDACLTTVHGISKLSAGDTLEIGAGTYTEAWTDIIPSGVNQATPTTVQAASGATVTIDGLDGTTNTVIVVNSKNYIDFRNLRVDGRQMPSGGSTYFVRIGVADTGNPSLVGSTYIRWIGGEITTSVANSSNGQSNCIGYTYWAAAGAESSNNTIQDSTIHNCVGTCGFNGCHCIYLNAKNTTISGNTVYDCAGWGVHGFNMTQGSGVDNNTIKGNTFHDNTNGCILASSGDSYLIYNNVCYSSGSGAASIRGYDGGTNIGIYNNTIYASGSYCIWNQEGTSGVIAKNNICYNGVSGILDSVGDMTCSSNFGISGCSTTQTGDPMFVDANSGDFHLQCHSGAIDTGVTLGTVADDFDGTLRPVDGDACGSGTPAYDMGAFEYINSQAPPPPPPYTGTPSKKPRLRIRIK